MAIINQATKELPAKIVYYGPASAARRPTSSASTSKPRRAQGQDGLPGDRDGPHAVLRLPAPRARRSSAGMKTRIQLYTVPGQVFYNATRKLVLKGADGVVFVADSPASSMDANLESFEQPRGEPPELELDLDDDPLRPPVQQARPAQRRPHRIHGVSPQQW